MPQLATKHFATITYQGDTVLEFPAGLPGFERERFFVPIDHPTSHPIVFLQSLSSPELCFITLPVLVVAPDYRLAIAAEDLRLLGLDETRQPAIGSEVLCLAVVSVAEREQPTANLLAPVVVNLKTRRAVQAIQEGSPYAHRHPLGAPQPEAACW